MVEPSDVPDERRYNNTIRYQLPMLLALPEGAATAIDAGCGEGLAARTMARAGLVVTGIDADADSIERARAQWSEGITYVLGDVLTTELEPADVVYSGAMLHHMDPRVGLERLRSWVKPGGALRIVGTARNTWMDLPREFAASVADKANALVRGSWEHGSPTVWPPAHTYRQVRDIAAEVLPGCDFQQRLLWRYTIEWTAPSE